MRHVVHATAWFPPGIAEKITRLATMQSSARRCAYQAVHRRKMAGEDVRRYVKSRFMDCLNARMVSDAVWLAKTIDDDGVVFGGRKAWGELQAGEMTKEEWKLRRNGQLYSRGDKNEAGNPNIRLYDDKILVNDPSGRGAWFEGKLWWPEKFAGELDLTCYDVRLAAVSGKPGTYRVVASWDDSVTVSAMDKSRGVVGIDCNPNGIAVVETDGDGNILKHHFLHDPRLEHARHSKRVYAARMMAIKVVNVAMDVGKLIVMEALKMTSTRKGEKNRKGTRKCNNFASQIQHEAVRSRAMRSGVEVVMVEAAYTSVLGMVKYAKMYSLSRHTAAALVIGRRGMGLKERKDFDVVKKEKRVMKPRSRVTKTSRSPKKETEQRLNLEGRGRSASIKSKGHPWFISEFVKPRRGASAVLTAPGPAPGPASKPGTRPRQQGEPSSTTAHGRRSHVGTHTDMMPQTGETTVYANHQVSIGS